MYASPRTEFVPVYGRRRVGKSELILKFIQNKTALYFLGKKAPATLQIKEFLEEASRKLGEPLLAELNVTDWKSAIKTVLSQNKSKKKFVLVLDEFQWMVEASPELPFVLQEFLDQDWKKQKNIHLIICGSYMGFMEREILGEKSPLFGRRTAQIFLKPFSYREAALFHPSWSLVDQAKAYFICGGIPLYLLMFSRHKSVYHNIEQNFFNEMSPLFREPDFLLREELRELQSYYGVLMCLATGANTGKAIAKQIGIDERKIYYYVQNLVELGYVRRHFPLAPGKSATRDVKFILADPLLKFWFRFVYPHTAYISQMGPRESFINLVKPNLDSYFGSCFEVLCREALAFYYQEEGVHDSFEIGEYWDKTVQIDVVGHRKNEGIDLGECKWTKSPSISEAVLQLEKKQASYPNPKGLTINKHLFLQLGPAKKEKLAAGVTVHTLADLYGK